MNDEVKPWGRQVILEGVREWEASVGGVEVYEIYKEFLAGWVYHSTGGTVLRDDKVQLTLELAAEVQWHAKWSVNNWPTHEVGVI